MDVWVDAICRHLVGWIPHPAMEYRFMQRALVALMIVGPMCATVGVHAVNLRLAFFAHSISHSAYLAAAVSLGLVLIAPGLASWLPMPVVLLVVGLAMALSLAMARRVTELSQDAVIGVLTAAVTALGIFAHDLLVRHFPTGPNRLAELLFGSVLTVSSADLLVLMVLALLVGVYQAVSYNQLAVLGVDRDLAQSMGVGPWHDRVLLPLVMAGVVMASLPLVGQLLVTSLLVIPAASARNLAQSAGSVARWAVVIGLTCAVGGLFVSDALNASTGASTVLVAVGWFMASCAINWLRQNR